MQPQEGRMFTFGSDPYHRMPVFVSGTSPRVVVWIGGQADGFFSLNYMSLLTGELGKIGWSVAQVQLESAQAGSTRTHVGDAEDLDSLFELLVQVHNVQELVLLATSTGVQVALEFLRVGTTRDWVTRVVLQGVVVDPEAPIFSPEGQQELRSVARTLVESGRAADLDAMRGAYDIPISPARVHSGGLPTLQEALWAPLVRGDVAEVGANFSCVNVPCLLMVALGTDYILTEAVRSQLQQRIAQKCGLVTDISLQFFNDTCDERRRMLKTAEAAHTAAIAFFLQEEDRKRKEREEAARQAQAQELRRSRSILAKSQLKEIA